MQTLGLIAGNGIYPETLITAARKGGVQRIVVAGFQDETKPDLAARADVFEWFRVGQLSKMIAFFKREHVTEIIMAGQIAPKNLFDLRPDIRTLLMLARLKERNAESLFGAIGDELGKDGITLLPATTHLEDHLATSGHIAGPVIKKRRWDDARFGLRMAKETSRLDIGQTVVVKNGTVLAVEAFEGTNETVKRGGALGRGGATLVKVSKPAQDMRFDVPVIGPETITTAADSGVDVIAVEAGRTLLLDEKTIHTLCTSRRISLIGVE